MLGGIKGIANSSQNLDEYFLSAAEMGNIITQFCYRFGISEYKTCKREDHFLYHLSGSRTKESETMFVNDVNFNSTDSVFNVLAKNALL